ncbi:ATP-binding protein [Caulobacter sp. Root342]|uniref:ATP-binding protein n=1 Tax=Caulobacter sp. Root342 TaxID=1736519 RepID=UPI0006F78E3F|nr:ATP-binding protein [Caulobacter sp. Root342]KQV54668.1 hypothetical protein ASC62_23035 [Caulobacter sp. Root342]
MTPATPSAAREPTQEGVPILLTGQALRSLRDSGYSLPTALAEVIDNSLEAKANKIIVRIDADALTDDVARIAVIDDGAGMTPDILQRYLQIGFSTRYMRTEGIGKYGVGAKLAALNFATKISVWSRASASESWQAVSFDLEDAIAVEAATGKFPLLGTPKASLPPKRYNDFLPGGAGTVVVWSKIDRLERGRFAATADSLVVELQQELSRIFREFLNAGIDITVNNTSLLPHDPLFLMRGTWAEGILAKQPGHKPGDHFPATVIADEPVSVGLGTARLRVTLYPPEVTRKRFQGGDKVAMLMRVPANEGMISFVRMNREIAYTIVPKMMPSGIKASDRFIGIELSFDARFDSFFGVRNVKRGVEPSGVLRDRVRELLKRYIPTARRMLDERWGQVAKKDKEHDGEHRAIMEAIRSVEQIMPKSKADPRPKDEIDAKLWELAGDVGHESDEQRAQYVEKVRELPFILESVDYPGKQFVDITHLSSQVLVQLNTRHRFYKEIWAPLTEIADANPSEVSGEDAVRTARRAIEGLTLMVAAYGKAQSMEQDPSKFDGLTSDWGKFLDTLMDKVRDVK